MDPSSSGRGVSQFKVYLFHRLEWEDRETVNILAKNDVREMLLFYNKFFEVNLGNQVVKGKTVGELGNNLRTAAILYEVLKAVVPPRLIDLKTRKYAEYVQKTIENYHESYNILPLHPFGAKPAIMELPEIKAAIAALHYNLENLPMPRKQFRTSEAEDDATLLTETKDVSDIFDWVSSIFGFQKANVANQREHLILLLANVGIRGRNPEDYTQLERATIEHLEGKIFENYNSWCKFLRIQSNCKRFPQDSDELQLTLIYISLHLLIWGEASNIRFMPECLCYIFHHMAKEVYVIIHTNIHPVSGETYETEIRDQEYFLRNIITPIYRLLLQESRRSRGGQASNSNWRNYDDLNEYFWSDKCFRCLGWPMDIKSDFFAHSYLIQPKERLSQKTRQPKINFVEVRTFWHLYRNFDRMWIFFALAFQAMVIVAWNSPSGSFLHAFFNADVVRSVLSIFITFASLKFLQATLDIVLNLKAWRSLGIAEIVRYLSKFLVAASWVVVMAMGYYHNLITVAIYLLPNILDAILFILPSDLQRAMDTSNLWMVNILTWWIREPRLFVGTDMHEDIISKMKYTFFWIMLLSTKLAFSYYVEIAPLVEPTKLIMEMSVDNNPWHEVFPHGTHNICVIISIWAPIVLVYFMDAQIWYAIFSTLFGGIYGAFSYLGEEATLDMLRSKFEAMSVAFNRCLMPSIEKKGSPEQTNLEPSQVRKNIANFSQMWNEFIRSMREEDLISNHERDLLLVPYYGSNDRVVVQCCPPFLLANKIPMALKLAIEFKGKNEGKLLKKIKRDAYMYSTVIECYQSLKEVISGLMEDNGDKIIVEHICKKVEESLMHGVFLNTFRMGELHSLLKKVEKLLQLLLSDSEEVETFLPRLTIVLQDIMEVITLDVMINGHKIFETADYDHSLNVKTLLRFEKINLFWTSNKVWKEKIVRLHLLLTADEFAIDVPRNLEARRRIIFFANSLFMNMPKAPKVRDIVSFSVQTPYYQEDVQYTNENITMENEDGISILFYLQKIYPDEWLNFMDRIKQFAEKDKLDLTRQWVSYREQTLYRTVRGMMYYRQALELQCYLELAEDSGFVNLGEKVEKAFVDQAQALVDLKFTYVLSCQLYGFQKKSNDLSRDQSCYMNILKLMLTYPSLRVAYIDTREEMENGSSQMVYYSVLVKGGDTLDEEIYRIKLPGPPTTIGEGKAENQNHAIIFTRGEALQTIDMNQENYFEEAFKMRNLLEEFIMPCHGNRKPTLLGIRENQFCGSVSSLAWFKSNQETSFVTIAQRISANLLRVRFHYGHSGIFDRIFHITRGGISKASRRINMSEEIFAGYNSTLRGGLITHHEYIQVGKGRDVGMNQISNFEAKVANGNGEETLSRDVYRLGRRFDFYRMLSFYFTTVGFYFSSMVIIIAMYLFLYGEMYMVMSGVKKELQQIPTVHQSKALEEVLAIQSVFQLGLILVLPIVMEIGLEKGFRTALGDFIAMQVQLASVFFTFQLGTKAHHYGRTILHADSRFRATGRGPVVFHAKFTENYRLYSRSHFVKGLELFILLLVYQVYGESCPSSNLYLFINFSMWFLVASWLFAPFVFNPCCFDWQKTVDDWIDWERWLENRGGIGISSYQSWESWWNEEQQHLRHTDIRGRVLETLLAFRFFFYQYGIVYHLDITRRHRSKSLKVYGLSWLVMLAALLVLKIVSMGRQRLIGTGRQILIGTGRQRFGTGSQLLFRILKAFLFLGFMSVMIVLFAVYGLTISDLFASILALFPTGWAIVLIAQAWRGLFMAIGPWNVIKELARVSDYIMGLIIFLPIAIFSWLPYVSELHKRLLFSQAFSRGLRISMILSGRNLSA
ncbi:callose synthase 7-like [Humulus lupulus]|uniref:callose synthase 7-like n=1 Tax=Humulus lupulus TaxID=3486 RepID=UPI002B404DFD|nr:callose synthase 7-like [Humulus lupulus]